MKLLFLLGLPAVLGMFADVQNLRLVTSGTEHTLKEVARPNHVSLQANSFMAQHLGRPSAPPLNPNNAARLMAPNQHLSIPESGILPASEFLLSAQPMQGRTAHPNLAPSTGQFSGPNPVTIYSVGQLSPPPALAFPRRPIDKESLMITSSGQVLVRNQPSGRVYPVRFPPSQALQRPLEHGNLDSMAITSVPSFAPGSNPEPAGQPGQLKRKLEEILLPASSNAEGESSPKRPLIIKIKVPSKPVVDQPMVGRVYPHWAITRMQRRVFDLKRRDGADVTLKEVIDDIKRQAFEIEIGLRNRKTGEVLSRPRERKPIATIEVDKAMQVHSQARKKSLVLQSEIFGRELSQEELTSVKSAYEKEFGAYTQSELDLAVNARKELLTRLANRKLTSREGVALANIMVAEQNAAKKMHLARLDRFPRTRE